MILPSRESIGWKKSLFTSPGWQKNENVWKSLECIMVNGVPRPKTLGACGPSGFGIGTFLVTPFTTIHPRLFHTLSQSLHFPVLSQNSPGTFPVLSLYFYCTFLILLWYFSGTLLVLSWYSPFNIQVLVQYFSSSFMVLSLLFLGNLSVFSRYSPNTLTVLLPTLQYVCQLFCNFSVLSWFFPGTFLVLSRHFPITFPRLSRYFSVLSSTERGKDGGSDA